MLAEIVGGTLNQKHIHIHVLLIINPGVGSTNPKFTVAAAPIQPACEPKIRSIDCLPWLDLDCFIVVRSMLFV